MSQNREWWVVEKYNFFETKNVNWDAINVWKKYTLKKWSYGQEHAGVIYDPRICASVRNDAITSVIWYNIDSQ